MTTVQAEGMALIERFKGQIYDRWREMRGSDGGADLAIFLYERGEHEVAVMMGPREDIIAKLSQQGVDFSKSPEVQKPASENNPFPAIGLWVIVGLEPNDASERRVAITRFVEPVLGRIGGGVTIGQA